MDIKENTPLFFPEGAKKIRLGPRARGWALCLFWEFRFCIFHYPSALSRGRDWTVLTLWDFLASWPLGLGPMSNLGIQISHFLLSHPECETHNVLA